MVPKILTKIAHHKEINYNLRNSTALQGRNIKTVMYASKNASSLEPKIWDTLLTELKKVSILYYLKIKLVNGPQRIVYVIYSKRT